MTKSKKILFIILGAVGVYALLWIISALAFGITACSAPEPAVPQIQYAEFPFTLVCELNGEEITYTDIIICEYKGYVWSDADSKKHRYWGKRFAGGEEAILCHVSEDEYIAIIAGSSAAYLMGDKENPKYSYQTVRIYAANSFGDESSRMVSFLTEEELYEDYGIKIISFEIAPPIENTFG